MNKSATRVILWCILSSAILLLLEACAHPQAVQAEVVRVDLADKLADTSSRQSVLINGQPYVGVETIIRTSDVVHASVSNDVNGKPALQLLLTPEAGNRMEAAAPRYLKKPLLMFLNGELVSAPVAQSALGRSLIIGSGVKAVSVSDLNSAVDAINQQSKGGGQAGQ